MTDRLEFPAHLTALGLVGEGVEVGVLFGEYSECLLANWPGVLHLVDPWEQQSAKVYRDGCNAVDMDEAHADTLARVAPFGDRARIHRKYSTDAAQAFADGQLDFVYIDANHSEAFVTADLAAWWPKLKPGGIIGGHDYYTEESKYLNCGVLNAVNTFALRHRLKLRVTPDCTSWWLTKEEPKTLVAVLGVSHVDHARAVEWLRWASFLCAQPGGNLSDHHLVISCTQKITTAMIAELEAAIAHSPGLFSFEFHTLRDTNENGYPVSASHLFVRSLEYAEGAYPGQPLLWLEADTVPLKLNWLLKIEDEYLLCNMPFMGHLEFDTQPQHMAGVAVYPPDWRILAPKLSHVLYAADSPTFGPGRGQAFDTYAASEVWPQAAEAATIHQIWKPDPVTTRLLAMISVDAVLFHHCKDARLIRLLAAKRFPAFLQEEAA